MSQTFVDDLFECTICLDVPASPIHTCGNGHIICGICAEQISKCGICESELQVSVLAERFSKQLDFKTQCPNFYQGCRLPIAAADVRRHIPNCYYRNVICNEFGPEDCNNVSVPLSEYVWHLQEKHKHTAELQSLRSLTLINNKLPEGEGVAETIVEDGNLFILHNRTQKDFIHFWVTIMGDKEDALRYRYELTLENETENNNKVKCSWTLPVLPYHDHPKFTEEASPLFVAIPMPNFLNLCSKNGDQYSFTTIQRIL